MKLSALVLGSLVLTACAVEDLDLSETAQGIKSPGIDFDDGTCPEWGCGSNSPKVELANFHDLHELGQRNSARYRILSFQKEYPAGSEIWRSYNPDVTGGRIRAITRSTTFPLVAWSTDADITGMRLVLENGSGQIIYIYIKSIQHIPFWVNVPASQQTSPPAAAGPSATTYELRWMYEDSRLNTAPGMATRGIAVCGYTGDADGFPAFNAVLFERDHIDADALRVLEPRDNWFNIGCQGHTLAKMHMMGHTEASSAVLHTTTTIAERTTLLKMLSGDYCGQGDPFTVAGAPLNWKDNRHWYNDVPTSSAYYDLEARWGENGAICLNVPRIDFQGGDPHFPGGVEAMLQPSEEWCNEEKGNLRPPPCLGDDQTNFWGGHLISANPIN